MSNYSRQDSLKYPYSRPKFLHLKTFDEIQVSADHKTRPIILPRDTSPLPWKSGYAECINAGKSSWNEDQATYFRDVLKTTRKSASSLTDSEVKTKDEPSTVVESTKDLDSSSNEQDHISDDGNGIPWVYFGLFDGHAGSAVAVAAATQLHKIIGEKLQQVSELMTNLYTMELCDTDKHEANIDIKVVEQVIGENHTNEQEPDTKENKADGDGLVERLTSSDIKPIKAPMKTDTPDDEESRIGKLASKFMQLRKAASSIDASKLSKHRRRADSANTRIADTGHSGKPLSFDMADLMDNNITVDSLVVGALEASFWEMDALIEMDKNRYNMPGGCTALVAVFILGKLYICNAGDSRAIVYKNKFVIPMSFDFTPVNERERILRLALTNPSLLGFKFTHLEFIRRPTKRDLGKQMLYKDASMRGWSMKTVTIDDLKHPLVWGEGKQSRVLATMGVTRGFGDHELCKNNVFIKPFLTPEPEVRIIDLCNDDDDGEQSLSMHDVLIMATDGLWDKTSNREAADIVQQSLDTFLSFSDSEESVNKYRYISAAQDLVVHARGVRGEDGPLWRMPCNAIASQDDITVFVIPLKSYRDEHIEWKRRQADVAARLVVHAAKCAEDLLAQPEDRVQNAL